MAARADLALVGAASIAAGAAALAMLPRQPAWAAALAAAFALLHAVSVWAGRDDPGHDPRGAARAARLRAAWLGVAVWTAALVPDLAGPRTLLGLIAFEVLFLLRLDATGQRAAALWNGGLLLALALSCLHPGPARVALALAFAALLVLERALRRAADHAARLGRPPSGAIRRAFGWAGLAWAAVGATTLTCTALPGPERAPAGAAAPPPGPALDTAPGPARLTTAGPHADLADALAALRRALLEVALAGVAGAALVFAARALLARRGHRAGAAEAEDADALEEGDLVPGPTGAVAAPLALDPGRAALVDRWRAYEARLAADGLARRPSEGVREHAARIAALLEGGEGARTEALATAARLFAEPRYGAAEVEPADLARLDAGAREALAALARAGSSAKPRS